MSEIDADIQPSSDSFWEVGQYKTTVRRVEDGFKLCNELMNLITERCEIEKVYAKSLKHWSKKWNDAIGKGPEYGTTQAAWRGLLEEAERVHEVHIEVKNDLLNDTNATIKQWQKENYHRNMMGVIKESKEFEDNFRRAQKPWAKRLSKVIKSKKEYHAACKTEKSLKVQLANSKGDSAVNNETVKKLQDKVDKAERDTELGKDKYTAALSDLNSYNAKYMEEMAEAFEKCQDFEEKRLKFFKEVMFTMHKCLNISAKEQMPLIFDDLYTTIQNTDHSQDLKWWANNHGTGMAMNWPTFEEYSPELKPINKVKASGGDSGVMLRGIRSSYVTDANNHTADTNHTINRQPAPAVHSQPSNKDAIDRQPSYDPKLNPFGDDGPDSPTDNVNPQNPFGDDWDTDLVDESTPGVPVRALYDYTALEGDELSLKAGDIFHRLSEEDGQGWCQGRKDGHVGLYPANYAEPI